MYFYNDTIVIKHFKSNWFLSCLMYQWV